MTLEAKERERQCRGILGLSLLPVSCSGLFYSHYQAQVFGKTHALLLSKSMSENPQYVLLQLLEAIPQVLNYPSLKLHYLHAGLRTQTTLSPTSCALCQFPRLYQAGHPIPECSDHSGRLLAVHKCDLGDSSKLLLHCSNSNLIQKFEVS